MRGVAYRSIRVSIGTIALVDLRMFGAGLTRRSAAQLVRDTDLWTMGGLAIVIMSGLAIFSSDPEHYMSNGPFQFKMAALLAAILYNYTIRRRVAMRTGGEGGASSHGGGFGDAVVFAGMGRHFHRVRLEETAWASNRFSTGFKARTWGRTFASRRCFIR